MSTARQKRLEKAQLKVLFRVPFFAGAVARLPVVFDDTVQTACTDGKEIRWNGPWFDSLPDTVLPTVLCHEACHCLFGHLWRFPGGDFEQWNIATDHAVNLMLKEFSAGQTGKWLADPFPFPEPQDAYCADPQFIGMAEELIFSKLGQRPKGPQGGGQPGAGPGQGQKQGGQKVQSTTPGGKTSPRASNAQCGASHSMPSFGQMKQPQPGQSGQSSGNKLRNEWEGALIQACTVANSRGELPAGMERLVDKLVKPQVPWWELLRVFLREQAADDWNWMRPDPTMDESGFVMPSLESESMGGVVFATDTSGSIDQELLAKFQAEKQNCLDELRPHTLLDIQCDAKIQKVAEYRAGDSIPRECKGGGGTRFEPVFEHIDGLAARPKCLVYLTDLGGSFPAVAPDYPVLWVTWTKGGTAPFGEVVFADQPS